METLDSHARHSCRLHFLNMLELLDCFAVFQLLPPVGRLYHIAVFPRQRVSWRRHWESDHLWSFCTAGWHSLPVPPVLVLTLTTFTRWSRWYNIYFFSPALNSSFLTSSWYWQWYWYLYYASQGQDKAGLGIICQFRGGSKSGVSEHECAGICCFLRLSARRLCQRRHVIESTGGGKRSNSFPRHMTKNLHLWAAWCVTTTWIPERGFLEREPVSSRLMLA